MVDKKTKEVKVKQKPEEAARKALLEDLFYDFHSSRVQIYKMNFVRGIFLGFGTVIGGTLVVALLIWILSLLGNVPGGIGDFVRYIEGIIEAGPKS